ncbi:DMT family transporter [Burkholderia sp. Bp8992]|uniref:DMT family transporter n=1 Tax=Burkholderia sp. Bp8992 TaxID=2184554 RepID=UPI000F560658|nr:DMT family transporter [Burkholderia sp. Bp8992]RQS26594.1 DMT family transporter [Burkholderia sp. Bp8992]
MTAHSASEARPDTRATLLLFATCVIIWSTNWFPITMQVRETPVLASLFWRFLLAALTLRACTSVLSRDGLPSARVPYRLLVAIGVTYFFGGIGLTYVASKDLTSAYVACLSTLVIFFAIAIKRFAYGTRILPSNVAGALLSTAGVLVYGGAGMASTSWWGIAVAGAAFALIAIGSVLSEHAQKRYGATSIQINTTAISWACALYFLLALATGTSLRVPVTAMYLLPLLYLGIVCSALVFVLYIALIGRIGAEYAGYISFIYPFGAGYLSVLVGESRLSYRAVGGGVLMVAGCLIAARYTRIASLRAGANKG